MIYLITGGAGFIGRWIVKELLSKNNKLVVIDNLSNSKKENLIEFENNPNFIEFVIGDIKNQKLLKKLFLKYKFTVCIHLAAQINVQESIENSKKTFNENVLGTFNLLEEARKWKTKIILIGTCLVYDLANYSKPISENHPLKPTSPYAGSKLACENLALSYYYGLKLPVVILRPFNTYGPFQKTNMEGGVVSIFINKKFNNEKLIIYGTGEQTRDFLYVEDCAEFIVKSAECDRCIGEIINAGLGIDISINELAKLIISDEKKIEHVKHHHPQSEIMKLISDNTKVKEILNWEPKTTLKEGIIKLENWIKENKMK